MRLIDPWSPRTASDGGLVDTLQRLRGHEITGARYWGPDDSVLPIAQHLGDLDIVRTGVEIVLPGLRLGFIWKMEASRQGGAIQERQGVGIVVEPDEEYFKSRGLAWLDVTANDRWAQVRGRPIVEVAASWHEVTPGAGECMWAVRMVFDNQDGVTVCLGDVEAGPDASVTYAPDSIAVLFGKSQAVQYRITEDGSPAWGTSLDGP